MHRFTGTVNVHLLTYTESSRIGTESYSKQKTNQKMHHIIESEEKNCEKKHK